MMKRESWWWWRWRFDPFRPMLSSWRSLSWELMRFTPRTSLPNYPHLNRIILFNNDDVLFLSLGHAVKIRLAVTCEVWIGTEQNQTVDHSIAKCRGSPGQLPPSAELNLRSECWPPHAAAKETEVIIPSFETSRCRGSPWPTLPSIWWWKQGRGKSLTQMIKCIKSMKRKSEKERQGRHSLPNLPSHQSKAWPYDPKSSASEVIKWNWNETEVKWGIRMKWSWKDKNLWLKIK
jgi:hypothetical protein